MENYVIEILKVGLPGLVFLLSFFSFKLLAREQVKKDPSQLMLKSIRHFMYINITLAILTAGTPFMEKYLPGVNENEPELLSAHDLSKQIRAGLDNIETTDEFENELLGMIKDHVPVSSISTEVFNFTKNMAIPVTLRQTEDSNDDMVAVVCDNSFFDGKTISLFDKSNPFPQNLLKAEGGIPCTSDDGTLMYVNRKLFDNLQNKNLRAKIKS